MITSKKPIASCILGAVGIFLSFFCGLCIRYRTYIETPVQYMFPFLISIVIAAIAILLGIQGILNAKKNQGTRMDFWLALIGILLGFVTVGIFFVMSIKGHNSQYFQPFPGNFSKGKKLFVIDPQTQKEVEVTFQEETRYEFNPITKKTTIT
ncbi:MAG: hypothetical protein ABIH42_11415, partial [Planctomycetota bacterium]